METIRGIVPPHLLRRIASLEDERFSVAVAAARSALAERTEHHHHPNVARPAPAGPGLHRRVHDAQNATSLPGRLVRSEGDPATGDVAVDEAYDGFGATDALFRGVYGRRSIDDADLPLVGTVHYGRAYDNAFWDGSRMVFGDGDGEIFGRFTASLSVIGHELTHGLIEFTAALDYRDQSGALNESIADVFGALVEQHAAGQTADQASWLIGAGLFTDQVDGAALRSMSAPGTAYDDDVLGRDPQPGHMDDYIETTEDSGGVHLNSGIPNKAFHLVATTLGGRAWEVAGRIWLETLLGGALSRQATFDQFARATIAVAGQYDAADVVRDAWQAVGVWTTSTSPSSSSG
ncbi:peptidase M4 family protein [Aeromicrobium sp. 636]|uniref:Neutral metalloproteinase n=1 Tax=Aeromicrobium senzhongii TaxID=2663859 RepID=A0A8I0K297_9ACTN|nr:MULTISPECIES: M4 family metallopeptidase [Aeromicrobium]MBC9225999.1 M4 family metallopeptidase [Aeromicrobium senzhongii]MCQ3998106.1 peptidase M4 family protein [Aeromicrobium sp. 636]MTB88535.1 peptidase M4 family protein [Aeromicrobium senzhongii]QNL94150.1 M4 family metallopeptidase [Aeromicrobium senzhongii]